MSNFLHCDAYSNASHLYQYFFFPQATTPPIPFLNSPYYHFAGIEADLTTPTLTAIHTLALLTLIQYTILVLCTCKEIL